MQEGSWKGLVTYCILLPFRNLMSSTFPFGFPITELLDGKAVLFSAFYDINSLNPDILQ